jgi:cytochrome c peroxidase
MVSRRNEWVDAAFALTAIVPFVGGCGATKMDGFSNEDWMRVQAIAPLAQPMPSAPFDLMGDDDAMARFGQRLFFDKRGAEAIQVDGPSGKGPYPATDPTTGKPILDPVTMLPVTIPGEKGKVSCATCHGSTYLVDARPFAVSHGRSWLSHNTPSMANLGYMQNVLWTGRFDSLREHGTGAMGGNSTTLAQIHFIYNFHRDEYNALFPNTPLDPALDPAAPDAARFPLTGNAKAATTVNNKSVMSADGVFEKMAAADRWAVYQFKGNMGIVFEAHPRKLNTPNSPFERYVRDQDASALTDQAKRGLRLFIGKASCIDCHNGPALTDNQFHNVGVPTPMYFPPGTTTAGVPDRGRGGGLVGQLNNQLMQLRTNAMVTDPMDQVPIFGGAGQYSDNKDAGLKHLQDLDQQLCVTRSTDVADVTASCQALFYPGAPEDATKTPPVPAKPADPRLQICITANMTDGVCTKYADSEEGSFRTPMLLNVEMTAPYFHTGQLATLRDVVVHYNNGGAPDGTFVGTKSPRIRPLGLSDNEIDDIVEFLKSLTGDVPDPNWICDPSLPPAPAGQPSVAGGACAAAN